MTENVRYEARTKLPSYSGLTIGRASIYRLLGSINVKKNKKPEKD